MAIRATVILEHYEDINGEVRRIGAPCRKLWVFRATTDDRGTLEREIAHKVGKLSIEALRDLMAKVEI